MVFIHLCRTVKENPSDTINSVALMKGGSANLEQVVPNILSAAIPVNPPTYDWNIPTTVETNPSCKFNTIYS